MIARTQTISSRTTPRSPANPSVLPALNVGRRAGAAFLSVRAKGNNVISSVLARRAIDVRMPPRIVGNGAAAQVGPVPRVDAARSLGERREALAGARIATVVEIEQIERAREALDLNARGLHLGFGEIVEHARSDQRHDQADDRDYHEYLDEREARLAPPRTAAAPMVKSPCHLLSLPYAWRTS